MNLEKIGLIDSRNQKLWKKLNETHSISVQLSDCPNYACYSENNESIVYVTENNIDINSFTHELLHIFIRQKEIFIGSSIKLLINGNETLSKVFSNDLIEHFGNCLDHIKMLPIYLELGFDKKKFITDYDVNKCSKSEVQALKNGFKVRGTYYYEFVDYYIGKFIAIKSDPKQHINYPKSLKELKNIDSNLFDILENLINEWVEMPIEKVNIWDDDYHSISYKFYENLLNWTKSKTFR